MRGIVWIKTDVFSFGVILLEIISGKKSNSHYDSDDPYWICKFVNYLTITKPNPSVFMYKSIKL